MGADLLLTIAAIDVAHAPDWAAAETHIESLTVQSVEDDEGLLKELGVLEEPLETSTEEQQDETEEWIDLAAVQRALRQDLASFRDGVNGERRDLDYVEVRGARVYITGGESWGDSPTELWNPLQRLRRAGVLAAAGFEQEPAPTGTDGGLTTVLVEVRSQNPVVGELARLAAGRLACELDRDGQDRGSVEARQIRPREAVLGSWSFEPETPTDRVGDGGTRPAGQDTGR